MSSDVSVKESIRTFLKEDPLYNQSIPEEMSDDYPLLDKGVLDSLGLFNLVLFLESRFEIHVEIEDLSGEHFNSLQSLDRFVQRKREVGSAL